MTNDERFDIILNVLGRVMLALTARGLGDTAVLIGGQVVSVERRSRNVNTFELRTPMGESISLPFSQEPDLLFNREAAGAQAEAIEEVLKAEGFTRLSTWRWSVKSEGVEVDFDILEPARPEGGGAIVLAGEMTFVRAKAVAVTVGQSSVALRVPDAASFFRLKLDARVGRAKLKLKDSFDMYAYARTVPVDEMRRSLRQAREGASVRDELLVLFGALDSPGTLEAVSMAIGAGDSALGELIARDVVDVFAEVTTK